MGTKLRPGHNVNRWTDRWTDRQTDRVIPIYPQTLFAEGINICVCNKISTFCIQYVAQINFYIWKEQIYDDVIPLMSSSWRGVEQEQYKYYTENVKRVVLELQPCHKGNNIKTLASSECRGHLYGYRVIGNKTLAYISHPRYC